ncbi:MAG: TlpA family protein disulfide reductase [Proteobacteria bacterium]|nr:TlpA family protein disulfide reductase [Pseudomonadota bacterium]
MQEKMTKEKISEEKIILFKRYQKSKLKNSKMFFLTVLAGIFISMILWHYFIKNIERLDVQIPASKNITFNDREPFAMTTAQVADELEKNDTAPTILYLYTTWCKICSENFATINEIAREFQNTDLKIIALAIDRDLDPTTLSQYLGKFGDFYFQPRFLIFKDGFRELLRKKNIRYDGRIPFTVLLSKDGDVVAKFTGKKNRNFLRNKIIKELYE